MLANWVLRFPPPQYQVQYYLLQLPFKVLAVHTLHVVMYLQHCSVSWRPLADTCFCMQLVQDLRTLRALAEYLLRFDAVTFLMYLENLRATEGVTSVWLFHDAAHTIFEQVR